MYDKLKNLFWGIIIAGVILVIIGMVFLIRAGLPYQDPNVEMVIEWTSDYLAGTNVTNCGLCTLAVGVVGILCTIIFGKKRKKNEQQNISGQIM